MAYNGVYTEATMESTLHPEDGLADSRRGLSLGRSGGAEHPVATRLKQPVQVYLRPEQLQSLRFLAQRRNVAISELIRQGVDKVLDEAPPEDDPLWSIIGIGDSGLGDLAEKHDEYLVSWLRSEHR